MFIFDHIRKLRGKGNETAGPRVVVAAFGKHPGWDDHIADIGLNTDALNACKTWLYVEGIRSLVDGGVWDELGDDERIDGYDHLFLQRTGDKNGGWLLGMLWSSTDGKGRSRYPMVVCVHAIGVERDWMLDGPLRSLESLREQCVATKSADDVRHLIRAEEVRLRNSLADPDQRASSAAKETDQSSPNIYAELAEQSALGPDHQGLYRVLYQLDRDMSAYRSTGDRSASISGSPTPRHLRVPAGDGNAVANLRQWMRLCERELAGRAPILLILPLMQEQKSWVDIIVGQPSATYLKCMRSRPKHTPLVTDVPYQIEPEFVNVVEELIAGKRKEHRGAEASRSPRRTKLSEGAAPAAGTGSGSRATGTGVRIASSLDPRILRIGGPLAAVLLLIVVIAVFMRGSDPIAPEVREHYATMHENWAASLTTARNREHLEHFIDTYGGHKSLVKQVDHVRSQYGHDMGLSSLATSDAFTSEEEIHTAIARLHEIRSVLLTLLEEARSRAEEDERLRDWRTAANEMRELIDEIDRTLLAQARDAGGVVDGRDFIERLSMLAAATETIDSIEPRWRVLHEKKKKMVRWADEHDDALVRQFAPSVREQLADARLDELSGRITNWSDAAERLAVAAQHWPHVDVTHLRQHSALYREHVEPDPEKFLAWADAVASPEFALLPEEADPREKRQEELGRQHARFHEVLAVYHRACGDGLGRIGAVDGEDPYRAIEGLDRNFDELESITWDRSRHQQQRINDRIDEIGRTIESRTEAIMTKIAQCESECEQRLVAVLDAGLPKVPDELAHHVEALVMADWQQVRGIADDPRQEANDCPPRLTRARNMNSFVRALAEHSEPWPNQLGPPLRPDDLPSGVAAERIVEIARAGWTSHLSTLIDGLGHIDWNHTIEELPLWRELERAAAEHQHWMSRASEMLADYREIERRLKQCYGWRAVHGAPDEEGIEPLMLRWHDSDVGSELRGRFRTLDELAEAAVLLHWIEQGDPDEAGEHLAVQTDRPDLDAPGLIAIAEDAGQWPAVRWAAWRVLERYVNEPAFLEWDRSLAGPMRSMLHSLDLPRRDRLQQQFLDGRQQRWLNYAAAVSEEETLEVAFAAMGEFVIGADELDGRLRFNYETHTLRRLIGKLLEAEGLDEELRRRVEQQTQVVLDRLDSLERDDPEENPGAAAAADIASSLRSILDFAPDAELAAGHGWNNIALARAGWQAEPSPDDSIVRFHPPPSWIAAHPEHLSNEPVEFLRVRDDENGASYLSRSELSAGLFIAAVEQRGEWEIVRHLLGRTHDVDGTDLRRGPRVWNWQRPTDVQSPMVVADQWLRLRHADCYPPTAAGGPPSADHPMQYVSAGAAAYVSMLLGCRLMSEEEWRSAYEAIGGRSASTGANLRGRAWVQYNEQLRGVHLHCDTPERDSMMPRARMGELDRDAAWMVGENGETYDDGVLWFRNVNDLVPAAVGGAAEESFRNVIGNVWEFTYEQPDVWRDLTPTRLAEQLAELTMKRQDQDSREPMLRVIGGSALSHPALGIDQAVPVEVTIVRAQNKWLAGFSDVGFRLAFSVSREDLGMDERQQFRQLLRDQLPRLSFVTSAGASR